MNNKTVLTFFQWINYFLSLLCVIIFFIILFLGISKIDTTLEKQLLAMEILFASTIIPSAIFLINGIIISAKKEKSELKDRDSKILAEKKYKGFEVWN